MSSTTALLRNCFTLHTDVSACSALEKKRKMSDLKEQGEEMFGRVKRPRMREEAVTFIRFYLWRAIDETARAITV
jgi:hypothetical protein